MARMLSHIGSVIRGSVGGLTYLANPYHQIVTRFRTCPCNPHTTDQGIIRSSFAMACSEWNLALDTVRAGWNEYAETLSFSGPLGPYSVPGRNIFIANYGTARYLLGKGITTVIPGTSPPVIPGFIGMSMISYGLPTTGTGFKLSGYIPEEGDWMVYAYRSRPFSGSRYRFNGPFNSDSIKNVVGEDPSSWIIEFTDLTKDNIYFVKLRAISHKAPHRLSQEFIIRCIADDATP